MWSSKRLFVEAGSPAPSGAWEEVTYYIMWAANMLDGSD